MRINYKALSTALAAIASVVVVHTELLSHFGESTKDVVTLGAFIIIALSKQIVEKHEN